jgi:signal recognition particle subunit SRP54
MFDKLTGRLARAMQHIRGQARITPDNIQDALREVRLALLEADVALPVVRTFIEGVRARAIGQEVQQSLTPGQVLVKIVHDELIAVMGSHAPLNLNQAPPAIVLLAGLQGAGKTTTAAKLARHIREQRKKSVLLTSCDIYRPAAMDQLDTLARELGLPFHRGAGQDAVGIAQEAAAQARRGGQEVLIVDTAGRLHVDAELMAEIRALHAALLPVETLFVVDAMMGQDAVNAARAFGEALPLTGVVLTKADGDTRGGAALSVRHITGQPIKFLGVGEKTGALEPFHPERLAGRILGMGDIVSLVEQVQTHADQGKAQALAEKLKKGKGFDFTDLRDQLQQMQGMGGVGALMDKLPGMGGMAAKVNPEQQDKELRRMVAIINSMTPKERSRPELINGSRRRRIAAGSGTQVQDVNRLLKQQMEMGRVMKKLQGGGMAKLMRGLKGRLPGGLPFG